MSFGSFFRFASWTVLLAYAYAGNLDSALGLAGDALDELADEINPLIPKPNGGWISPEYKWFFEYPLPIPPQKTKKLTWTGNNTNAEIDYYEVELKAFTKQIYPNLPPTQLEGYDGVSPGPTFRMQQGREAVVRFTNNGAANMSIHVHGQYNRAPFDGWAGDYAPTGWYKDYYYPNAQNARTIWYHDHTEFKTAENAYRGQEGFYILSDAQEQGLGLPSGQYDVPLALSAKAYNSDGSLKFDTINNLGLWGDIIEVNGQPWPYFNVEPRKYRFRLLDASLSRTFTLSIHEDFDGDALSFDVIGSDCGLLSRPITTEDLTISMGERWEIIVDFGAHAGQNLTMRNSRSAGENVDYAATNRVMQFNVGDKVTDPSNNDPVPQTLRELPSIPTDGPSKDFAFSRNFDRWVINGVGFSDVENRILTRPTLGNDEIWVLRNVGGGMAHPVHIHLVDFQVLSRTGGRNDVLPYEEVARKDVVFIAPGEAVQVVARYAPWPGVYMFHCHNLIHEDHDMLVAFNVTKLAQWGYPADTQFIDPMQPEFRPKPYSEADFTDNAIREKIAWFYSTNAYKQGETR